MVRKVSAIILAITLICAIGTTAFAGSHLIYEGGKLSSSDKEIFKDILSGVSFSDNYCAFRNGQSKVTMVVGDIEFIDGQFVMVGERGKEYIIGTNTFEVKDIYWFELEPKTAIVYSDVGGYPELVERGDKYEMLQTLLIIITLLCVVISRIFYNRKR